ncbi:MAG: metallophosphoesterase [Bacteroidetes bacterium]|nr:metallophosphoesterase [Bacteroidota bacterium]
MYRIAHITDLHIKSLDLKGYKKQLYNLLDDIKRRDCNHIFITGDMIDNGEEKDYHALIKIFNEYGLMNSDKISVTIGNHEIYGGTQAAEDVFLFPTRCQKTDYNSQVKLFYDFFKPAFEGADINNEENPFPYCKILFDKIAVIGVNSNAHWSKLRNPIGSNGAVYDEQYKKLSKILESHSIKDKIKIVLIHHHFNKISESGSSMVHSLWLYVERRTMKLHNKKRLFKLFKEAKVDLILHGHTHISDSYNRKGSLFVNSSACVIPFTESKLRKYHIIKTPKDKNRLTFDLQLINL